MVVHLPCSKHYRNLIEAILTRAEMDHSVFDVMYRTGRDWNHVRRAIDPAMSDQNVEAQEIMRDLLSCECPIYRERRPRE